MRTKKRYTTQESVNFDLSISDLMAGLCGIFVLVLITVIMQLNNTKQEYASKNQKAEEYRQMRDDLYDDLMKEFAENLQEWNAEIDEDLTIIFRSEDEKNPMFQADKSELNIRYKEIFSDFFPRLVKILNMENGNKGKYIDNVEEIRIEGHTSIDKRSRSTLELRNNDYEVGMVLSQERTREVMLFCLNTVPNEREEIQKNIAAIGYSNSRPVTRYVDSEKNRKASRRVEFKIKTCSEEVLEEIRKMPKSK